MSSKGDKWVRVRRGNLCPICGHDSWCLISQDGETVICARTESDRAAGKAGWIHRMGPDAPKPKAAPKPKRAALPTPEIEALAIRCYQQCQHPELLANELGVSVASMRECGLGYDGRCWTHPEFNADRRIIGLKLRPPAGKKFYVSGSHPGITWPKGIGKDLSQPLLICEGFSDTSAARDMGFDVLGRPACRHGGEIILEVVTRVLRYRTIWIIADNDPPDKVTGVSQGLDGGQQLAAILVKAGKLVKMLHPPLTKDIRSWYQAGATKPIIEALAKNARFYAAATT